MLYGEGITFNCTVEDQVFPWNSLQLYDIGGCNDFEISSFIIVRQISKEFLRAGADIIQAFTFYASDDKLENRANESLNKHTVSINIPNLHHSVP